MKLMKSVLVATGFCLCIPAMVLAKHNESQQITRHEQLVYNQAPAANFTGEAQFSRLPIVPSSGDVAPAIVHFAANTITNWHVHPHGQYLIVIEGEGRTQEWGKPIQHIAKGDVIWCPPGVKHWHGAGEYSSMSHIVIGPVGSDGQSVNWLEKVVLPAVAPAHPKAAGPVTLTAKQLSLISIAAFNATGNVEKLRPALVEGLESGLTVNEIKEVFAHQYAYAGFPRALNGMLTFKSLLEQRLQQGIIDPEGPIAAILPANTDFYQSGSETLAYLNQISVEQATKPLFDNFSPTMDHALKAHLFGYLFSRDNLGYLERELVVVSTLSAFGDVNAQLRSHLRITKNLGLDDSQMQKIVTRLEQAIGSELARNTQSVLQQLQ